MANYSLSGQLDIFHIQPHWQTIKALIQQESELSLDFAQMEQSSSAVLALLLQAIQDAEQHQCRLILKNMPSELIALASLSHIESILEPYYG